MAVMIRLAPLILDHRCREVWKNSNLPHRPAVPQARIPVLYLSVSCQGYWTGAEIETEVENDFVFVFVFAYFEGISVRNAAAKLEMIVFGSFLP